MMRRLQIQVDEETYEALRRRAFEQRKSLAATVRELLGDVLRRPSRRRKRRWRIEDLSWIGSFSRKDPYVVSENIDRALGELDRW